MRIVCFGDSNTYGYDPRNWFGGRYAQDARWPDLLAKHTGRTVINLGVNGQQIPAPSAAACSLGDARPCDCVLIMLGTNDLLQDTSPQETAQRMEAFLSPLLSRYPRLFLIAPPPLKRGAWVDSDSLVDDSAQLVHEYQRLAQRQNIPFLSTAGWDIPLAYDGVHFTEEGHRIFAAKLAAALRDHPCFSV